MVQHWFKNDIGYFVATWHEDEDIWTVASQDEDSFWIGAWSTLQGAKDAVA